MAVLSPLSHVAGLSIILRSAIYGTTTVLLDGFDTEQVASTLVNGDIMSSPWFPPS